MVSQHAPRRPALTAYGARFAAQAWLVALPLRLGTRLLLIGISVVDFGFDCGAIGSNTVTVTVTVTSLVCCYG